MRLQPIIKQHLVEGNRDVFILNFSLFVDVEKFNFILSNSFTWQKLEKAKLKSNFGVLMPKN